MNADLHGYPTKVAWRKANSPQFTDGWLFIRAYLRASAFICGSLFLFSWKAMTDYFRPIESAVIFSMDRAAKADLFQGRQLFVGLNCFEPGQSQKVHVHAGADKFYLIVSGKARMIVGEETRDVGVGTLIWAPADLPHGVVEALERTVMLVAIAPPPRVGHALPG